MDVTTLCWLALVASLNGSTDTATSQFVSVSVMNIIICNPYLSYR